MLGRRLNMPVRVTTATNAATHLAPQDFCKDVWIPTVTTVGNFQKYLQILSKPRNETTLQWLHLVIETDYAVFEVQLREAPDKKANIILTDQVTSAVFILGFEPGGIQILKSIYNIKIPLCQRENKISKSTGRFPPPRRGALF